jgi:uncharacterized protein YgiM (DUF1202 family)
MYKGYVTAEKLNIRSKPAYNSESLDTLDQYDVVPVFENKGSWLEIGHAYGRAYVNGNYIEPLTDRTRLRGLCRHPEAYVWSSPNEEGTYIGSVTNQIYFEIIAEQDNWLKIIFIDQFAWMRSELVKQMVEPDQHKAIVTADFLNIRCKPSGRSRKLGMIKKGSQVRIISKEDNWVKIYFQNMIGFIHKNYIKMSVSPVKKPLHLDPFWLSIGLKPKKRIQNIKDEKLKTLMDIWNRYGNILLHLAHQYKIPAAVAAAVFSIESNGKGYINQRMIIRFENHQFWRWWGQDNPSLYNDHFLYDKAKVWQQHQFRPLKSLPWESFHGKQSQEWDVFNFACKLDKTAAMKSISMGLPQIMGFNYKRISYSSVTEMFDNFSRDIRFHIMAFFEFLDPLMITALRNGNFRQFAQYYNGPGQADYYADWLSEAYSSIVYLIPYGPKEMEYRLTG